MQIPDPNPESRRISAGFLGRARANPVSPIPNPGLGSMLAQ